METGGTVIATEGQRSQDRPHQDAGVEELKRNIDLLNYFYYLLSHPGATVPAPRHGARAMAG